MSAQDPRDPLFPQAVVVVRVGFAESKTDRRLALRGIQATNRVSMMLANYFRDAGYHRAMIIGGLDKRSLRSGSILETYLAAIMEVLPMSREALLGSITERVVSENAPSIIENIGVLAAQAEVIALVSHNPLTEVLVASIMQIAGLPANSELAYLYNAQAAVIQFTEQGPQFRKFGQGKR